MNLAQKKPERHRFRRFLREQTGSELVEFALLAPVLLMTTVGSIEVLLFVSSYIGATFGSRNAVRYAAMHGASSLSPCSAANLSSQIGTYMIGIPGSKTTVTPAWAPNNAVGSTVTVQVSVTYPTGIPYARPSTMSATTTASGTILQ